MALSVFIALCCVSTGPARAAKVPAGMIPYDKPVFKNGRRVLYHGPSRSGGKAAKASRASQARAAPAAPVKAQRATESAAIQPPAEVRAGALGAAVAAPVFGAGASDAVTLTLAMEPRLGAELIEAMKARGVELVLADDARADLLVTPAPLGPAAQTPAGLAAIARLYDCEVAVVGAGAMKTIADLAGKRVAAAPAETAAGRVARRVFAAASVAVAFVDAAPGAGGAAMREGRADAYVVVAPAPRIDDAPPGAKLIAVPYVGAMREQFLPAELGKATFPTLIDRDPVDTVAQPVVLAATDADRDPARRAALARFTDAFFSALGAGALPDAKWRDVNPAAKLPFPRFEAAQSLAQSWARKAWIDKARAN